MNIVALLDEAARRNPDTAAIIDGPLGGERVTTYAELRDRSRRIATLLSGAGLAAGDGLAILVPMSATLYAVIAAALRLGALPVFLDPRQPAPQLDLCRAHLPVRGFVGTARACLWRLLTPSLRAIEPCFVSRGWFPGARSLSDWRHAPPWPDDSSGPDTLPAMLTFTSGSTGQPKGVLRDHGLLAATLTILARHLDLQAGGVDLATMPALVMANLGQGVASLIPDVDLQRPGQADPARLARSVQRWRARSLLASPALVERLADHCRDHGLVLDTLRAVHTGGAPVFPRVLDKIAAIAPGAVVHALYGSTEAEPMAMLARAQLTAEDRRAIASGMGLPAGRPIPEIDLAILADRFGQPYSDCSRSEFQARCLAAGATGEIAVSGPHVAGHYLGGQGDGETKFRVDGQVWHRTGDAGRLDDQGRLWLAGRCAARLEGTASTLYPLTLEAALSEHPQLAHAAFVQRGGKCLLVLEWRPGAAKTGLAEFSAALPWAGIEALVELPQIPLDRRHNAKIDYPALHRALAARGV